MVAEPRERYRNRLLALIAFVVTVAALRASYPVAMPLAFAALIVGAVWPLKRWFDHWLPSWLSYTLAILALLIVLVGFSAAVYFSLGQTIAVLSGQWDAIQSSYQDVVHRAAGLGVPMKQTLDGHRAVAMLEMLAASVYQVATYTGFIALLVILGLPEVPRLRRKMHDELAARAQGEVADVMTAVSAQIRRYLGTTLATSVLTGVASAVWALMTGLDLALVWGLLNFLLNFVPVIGNIIGIIPPTL